LSSAAERIADIVQLPVHSLRDLAEPDDQHGRNQHRLGRNHEAGLNPGGVAAPAGSSWNPVGRFAANQGVETSRKVVKVLGIPRVPAPGWEARLSQLISNLNANLRRALKKLNSRRAWEALIFLRK